MSDSLNSVDILKSELIQALYRTQIRKGEAIKVYYTSNLRNILQDIVENYFKINSSEMFEDENNEQLLDYLKEKIDFEKLDKERKKFIEFVCYGSNVKKVFDFLFLNKEVKLNTTEIAKISGKRHDNLMRELLKVLENINLSYNRI